MRPRTFNATEILHKPFLELDIVTFSERALTLLHIGHMH